MARVLLLRDEAGAAETAAVLARHGHEAVALPIQEIVGLDPAAPIASPAGLLLTSRHAVPWAARHVAERSVPVLAVGGRTGAAAREAGFARVRDGAGEAADLVSLAQALGLGGQTILYPAGRVRRPETERAFAQAGTRLDVIEVYDTRMHAPGEVERERARAAGAIDAAFLLSIGQARAFDALGDFSRGVRPLCLSARIREALSPEHRASARVAARPTLAALLALLEG